MAFRVDPLVDVIGWLKKVSETDQHALHQYARNVKERDELYKELLEGYTEKYSLEKTWGNNLH